ncbi:hypothetical protein D1818_20650 [Aquimarina sp. BL5]|uniref:hypothetical protein n=1 Tax=Aquimarina sp. BL5 TaxID=1714860 RepID=UPI000E4DDC64|nr:hypothetical protein [Aquimarina sp. BL5]AXT53115.1 hypothetical protein D1818_20650 [Aquimarina sp. BL5]RKN03691.1 hypothetical protein D7036_13360 [Aquimarina sp. BL5]
MNTKFSYYLELAARWHVFILLSIYGSGKLLGGQFYRKGNLPEEIAKISLSEVGGFDLAWTFMGYSYSYILFIGTSQLVGAFLLLFRKTKLIGVIILLPILINIIVFDTIFLETYGALASAIVYFLLLLYILWYNKKNIVMLMKAPIVKDSSGQKMNNNLSRKLVKISLVFGVMMLIFGMEQLIVNYLGH